MEMNYIRTDYNTNLDPKCKELQTEVRALESKLNKDDPPLLEISKSADELYATIKSQSSAFDKEACDCITEFNRLERILKNAPLPQEGSEDTIKWLDDYHIYTSLVERWQVTRNSCDFLESLILESPLFQDKAYRTFIF